MTRVFLFLAAAAVCVLGYLFLTSALRGSPAWVVVLVPAFLLAMATALLNALFLRRDGETLGTIGFDAPLRRIPEAAVAFAAGCALVAGWAAILWLVAAPRWHPYEGWEGQGAVLRVGFCVFNNSAEELVYRGYLLRALARRFGAAVAVVSTSLLFAVVHVQAGVPPASAATVVFTSAVLFGVMVLRWRSLPLVIGFHVATNFAQEVLGLRVSPLTVWRPGIPAAMTSMQTGELLVFTAVLNLALAWLVIRSRPSRGRGVIGGDEGEAAEEPGTG